VFKKKPIHHHHISPGGYVENIIIWYIRHKGLEMPLVLFWDGFGVSYFVKVLC